MKIIATKTFEKQFKKVPMYIKTKVAKLYPLIEAAKTWEDIPSIKRMVGFENTYRVRIVDFRIGIVIVDTTCKLVVIMNRKEIYRYFP